MRQSSMSPPYMAAAKAQTNARLTDSSSHRAPRLAGLIFVSLAAMILFLAPPAPQGVMAAEERVEAKKSRMKAQSRPYTDKEAGFIEEEILKLTNAARKKKKLAPLKMSEALRSTARTHSADMCRARILAHESDALPEGRRKLSERLSKAGLRSGGENIAFHTTVTEEERWAAAVFKGWIESPAHRENILNPRFRYIGVGLGQCRERKTITYITQVFSDMPGKDHAQTYQQSRPWGPAAGTHSVDDATRP